MFKYEEMYQYLLGKVSTRTFFTATSRGADCHVQLILICCRPASRASVSLKQLVLV